MATIAVHGSNGLARRWPNAIRELGATCRSVNGYANSIIQELRDCDALLWHVDQDNVTDLRFARSVLLAAAEMGLRVYPNHASVWHFDDKVAQRYLLEAVGAPLPRTWVFYDRAEALRFVEQAAYPLVFKLRTGAASKNVRLLRSRREARKMVDTMFGNGMSSYPVVRSASDVVRRVRRNRRGLGWMLRNGLRVGSQLLRRRQRSDNERGYVLLQEFVEGNDFDTRVVVIGHRAFAFRRGVRPGDFRASGGGFNTFLDEDEVEKDVVVMGRDIARRLGMQTAALDFVRDARTREPVLLEVSFATIPELVDSCKGFFDDAMKWHPGSFDMAELVLHDLMLPEEVGRP